MKPREFWINCCVAFDDPEHLERACRTWHKRLEGSQTFHVIEKQAYNELKAEIERMEDLLHSVYETTLEADTKSRIASNMDGTPNGYKFRKLHSRGRSNE